MAGNRFWDFHPVNAAQNKPTELILYGDISSTSWWGDEVTPKQFSDEMIALGDVNEIVVRINSGGGDVFAAFAIYTRLKDHKAHITVKIDGWCGSAATIIAMSGDVISIPGAGAFMVHDPAMGVRGYFKAEEFTKMAEELQVIKNCIINAYSLKTGKDKDEIAGIMAAETWYTGAEAVANGFCNELMFEEVETQVENASKIIVNSVVLDVSQYRNLPVSILNSNPNQKQKEGVNPMQETKTIEDLAAAYPDLVNQITENAGLTERTRIQSIENMAPSGFEDVITNAKFVEPVSAEAAAMKIIAVQKEQGQKFLEDREKDIEASGMKKVQNSHQEGTHSGKSNPFIDALNKMYPKNN